METTQSSLAPKQLVLAKYPKAFADDDGEWVRIYNQKSVTSACPHCHQPWTRYQTDFMQCLGAGGNEESAWKNAAEGLSAEPTQSAR